MGFVDRVSRSRHPAVMTDNEVIDEAAPDGVELEERPCQDAWVWAGAAATTPLALLPRTQTCRRLDGRPAE
jgi:hypothetical protein